ncbi:serine protease, partial [Streptomyces sp. F8]|nr:serine protease [Streptomyces sp. F8]
MTESFRREGEYPQEHRPQHAPFGEDWQRGRDRLAYEAGAGTGAGTGDGPGTGAYPPPPAYPPA